MTDKIGFKIQKNKILRFLLFGCSNIPVGLFLTQICFRLTTLKNSEKNISNGTHSDVHFYISGHFIEMNCTLSQSFLENAFTNFKYNKEPELLL